MVSDYNSSSSSSSSSNGNQILLSKTKPQETIIMLVLNYVFDNTSYLVLVHSNGS